MQFLDYDFDGESSSEELYQFWLKYGGYQEFASFLTRIVDYKSWEGSERSSQAANLFLKWAGDKDFVTFNEIDNFEYFVTIASILFQSGSCSNIGVDVLSNSRS